jgi:hypothetical protein
MGVPMNLEEIQQAITELTPNELARFREWLKEYKTNVEAGERDDSKPPFEEVLNRLRGSYKGKGLMEALMEERLKERG